MDIPVRAAVIAAESMAVPDADEPSRLVRCEVERRASLRPGARDATARAPCALPRRACDVIPS